MSTQSIVLVNRRSDGIAYVTMNRPAKLNALNSKLYGSLTETLISEGNNDKVRVIILRGAGRAFSAGADIGSGRSRGEDTVAERLRVRAGIMNFLRIWEIPKPIIAQVHGYCFGTAMALCVYCDLVFVAEDAVIGWPGLPTGGGYLSPMAAWVMGIRKAKEFSYLLGERFSGQDAVNFGWANRAFPADRLEAETHKLAARIAKVPPDIMRLKKEANNRLLELMGFRAIVQMGAEFDAIGHMSNTGRKVSAEVAKRGYKAVAESYGGTT
jgi:enoyl-CoA hydratase